MPITLISHYWERKRSGSCNFLRSLAMNESNPYQAPVSRVADPFPRRRATSFPRAAP